MLMYVMSLIINGMLFNNLDQKQVEFLSENYSKYKMSELKEMTGLCDETIYRIFKAKGIQRTRMYKIYLPQTEEVENKLKNPYLSHVLIAKEYNVTESCVAIRRKALGIKPRRGLCRTSLEQKLASDLDKLDIAYTEQKRITKWSFDFYLGNKTLLDIHGDWSHSKPTQMKRDVDKTKWAIENKYSYMVVFEDFENIDAIKSYYWASLYSNIQSINRENCWNPNLLQSSKAISSRAIQGWMEGSETNHIPLDTVMQWTRVPDSFMFIKDEDIVRLLPKGKERN